MRYCNISAWYDVPLVCIECNMLFTLFICIYVVNEKYGLNRTIMSHVEMVTSSIRLVHASPFQYSMFF
jgi:hypothetical protein